ncbi:hypothetical protein GCM10018782_25610 [Streptomyces griseoaurantiacus]|nr:hypothetical protein GCM10018782_25610 [Streptomyces griseoaurantiacus]
MARREPVGRLPEDRVRTGDYRSGERGDAQQQIGGQPGQGTKCRQQLQRDRAAPWDPVSRVEAMAKFASMPPRTAVHTCGVNSSPGVWGVFHLIRSNPGAKGLLSRIRGHMAHTRAHGRRCDPVIRT